MSKILEYKIIEEYWIKKLKSIPIQSTLRYRRENESSHRVVISIEELEPLRAKSKDNELAKFVLLLSIYHILLAKYFKNNNPLIVTPDIAQDGINGLSDRLLLFDVTIAESMSVQNIIHDVKKEVQDVLVYRDYELSGVGQKMQDDNVKLRLMNQYAFRYSPVHYDLNQAGKDTLALNIESSPQHGLVITATGNSGFMDSILVESFVNHFKSIVVNLIDYLPHQYRKLDFLGANEKEKIFKFGRGVFSPDFQGKTLIDLFENQVKETPDHIAVGCNEETFTYDEINREANKLANYLRNDHFVGRDTIVGLLMTKSKGAIVSLLAVLKAGGAYLPIAVDYPLERIEFILKDSAVNVVITDADNLPEFHNIRWINFPKGDFLLQPELNPGRQSHAEDLAYVIYTSGSTGRPKGVMIEHGSCVNMVVDQIKTFGIKPSDKVLWFSSLSFDASASEVFMTLSTGATLLVPDRDAVSDKELFVSLLQDKEVSVVTLPPSYLDLLSKDDLRGIKCLISAGEPANVSKARDLAGNLRYFNAYGPTECAVCASIYEIDFNKTEYKSVPIGRPIANVNIYVLDEFRNLVPIGVPGLIYISGICVGRGYLNKPDLTNQKFLLNPFNKNERMYDTGDTGRWLSDGNLEFIGRQDDQVKIHGYRIELAEIESAMQIHSEIEIAVALACVNKKQEKEMIAFYKSKRELAPSEVRSFLGTQLPGYMIPSRFIQVSAFPKTPNGKIDRSKLASAGYLDKVSGKEKIQPRNEIERKIKIAFEEILGNENIGVTEDFFDLGGHSLKATRIISQIHREFDLQLKVNQIFDQPTVESIAAIVKANLWARNSSKSESSLNNANRVEI